MPIATFERKIDPVTRRPVGPLLNNPMKKAVREFFLQLDDETVTIPASGTQQPAGTTTQDAHFEGAKIMGRTTDVGDPNISPRMLVTLRSSQIGWNLMNRAVHWGTIMGTNLQPYYLPATIFVPGAQSLIWTFQDFSGAPQTVQAAVEGRSFWYEKFEGSRSRKQVEGLLDGLGKRRWFPYWMTTDQAITQVQTTTEQAFPMTIPYQGDFEGFKISAISDAPFQWTLVDTYTGNFWHNRVSNPFGVDSRISLGSATFPMEFSEPTTAGPTTKLMLSVRSLALVGGQNRIFVTVGGRIILPEGA